MTTPSKPTAKKAAPPKATQTPQESGAKPATAKAPHVGQVVTFDAPGTYGGQITGHGVIVAIEKTDDGKIARVAAFTDVRAVPVDSLQAAD